MSRAGGSPVVVVGAGPAGSVAAARLALSGVAVRLLEASALPRDKVCGDVLLPEIDSSLAEIGTGLDALAPDAWQLDGCRYTLGSGPAVSGRFADAAGRLHPWRILPRQVFDARLARHAVRCGARLDERHRLLRLEWDARRRVNKLWVAGPRGVERLEARLVVGADGAGSRVARDRGLATAADRRGRHTFVAVRGYADWPVGDRRATVVTERGLMPGCCWVVPQAGGRANVGIGMRACRRGEGLRARLGRLLERHGLAVEPRGVRGWLLPAGHARRRAAADGVMLVGDAAGLVDPFTGHGIHTAMRSALAAAAVARRAVAAGDYACAGGPLAGYERAWRRAMLGELRVGGWLQRLHSHPLLTAPLVARAAASRRWADRFIGLVGHAIPRADVLGAGFVLDLLRPEGAWQGAGRSAPVPDRPSARRPG